MALTIDLGSQTSVSIAGGDILQLPQVETLGNKNVSINVVGSAILRPASGEKVNNVSGDTALTEGKYLLFTTGAQNANWSLLSTSAGGGVTSIVAGTNITIDPVGGTGDVTINASGGVTNPLEENLDANTFDITGVDTLQVDTVVKIGGDGNSGNLDLLNDINDTEFYSITPTETPGSIVVIDVDDPGVNSVQLGLVDSAGGSDGQVPVWNTGPGSGGYFSLQDPSGGSGNVYLGPDIQTEVTDNYQILNDDRVVIYTGSGGHTLTLPTDPEVGQMHNIVHYGSGYITISSEDTSFPMPAWAWKMTFIYVPSDVDYNWTNLGPYHPNAYYYPTSSTVGIGGSSSAGHARINADSFSAVQDIALAYPGETGLILSMTNSVSQTNGSLPIISNDGGGNILFTFNEALVPGSKRMGVATVVSGTVTVNTTAVTANSIILLTPQHSSSVSFTEDKASRVNGTSFVINASADCDFAWMVVEP